MDFTLNEEQSRHRRARRQDPRRPLRARRAAGPRAVGRADPRGGVGGAGRGRPARRRPARVGRRRRLRHPRGGADRRAGRPPRRAGARTCRRHRRRAGCWPSRRRRRTTSCSARRRRRRRRCCRRRCRDGAGRSRLGPDTTATATAADRRDAASCPGRRRPTRSLVAASGDDGERRRSTSSTRGDGVDRRRRGRHVGPAAGAPSSSPAPPATGLGDAEAVDRGSRGSPPRSSAPPWPALCEGATAHHRRVRDRARAVRHEDRHLPGRRPAHGRRLHRHPGRAAHRPCRPRGGSAEGLPADEELHIAKWWAADGGHRVAHAAQHLHGGIGLDVDYPVHRYFRWIKVLELQLGSGTEHLRQPRRRSSPPTPA